MPPMLASMIAQLNDGRANPQYRQEIANRLSDVASELVNEVAKFRRERGRVETARTARRSKA